VPAGMIKVLKNILS